MKKYALVWLLCVIILPVVVYEAASFITNTSYENVFREFEVMLLLICFSIKIATMLSCTMFLSGKLRKK